MIKSSYLISLLSLFPLLAVAASEDRSLDDELAWLRAEAMYTTTASKMKESLDKTTATVTTITQQQISEMGARNLLDVLKLVPGFGVTQSRYGMRQIEVRGVSTLVSEKVLFLLNGHPLDHNLLNAGSVFDYDDLPVGTIKRIEIVRGPGSALYGANAFLAVVNIITQNAKDLNGFHASVAAGSFGTQQYQASWGKQFDNSFEAALHFNYADTKGIRAPLYTDSSRSVLGKSQLNEGRYDFEWQLGYKDFKFEGRYIDKSQGAFFGPTNVLVDNQSKQNYENYFLKLSRQWKVTDAFAVDTQIFYDVFTMNNTWQLAPNLFWHNVVPNKRIGGEVQANYTVSNSQKIIAGFSYAKEIQNKLIDEYGSSPFNLASGTSSTTNKKRSRWGVYAQDIWDPFENLRLTLGLRYDNYSDFGGTLNPRVGLNWEFVKDYSLKFSYGTAYRAPSFGELTYTNPVAQGNSSLQPEIVKTFEGGIVAHPVSGLTTQAIYYNTRIDKIITYVPLSGTNTTQYGNSGNLVAQGVEGEIRYDFDGDFKGSYLSANSVWQRGIQSGIQLADVPRYRTNLMANWAINRTWSSFAHVLIKSRTLREAGDLRPSTAGYTTVDLGILGKNIFNQNAQKVDIGFNVYNVFDKRYYSPAPQNLNFVGDFQDAGIAFFGHVDVHF